MHVQVIHASVSVSSLMTAEEGSPPRPYVSVPLAVVSTI